MSRNGLDVRASKVLPARSQSVLGPSVAFYRLPITMLTFLEHLGKQEKFSSLENSHLKAFCVLL